MYLLMFPFLKHFNKITFIYINIYLVQKETHFYLHFLGLKNIDFQTCFNSVVLPSNKDIDCILSS